MIACTHRIEISVAELAQWVSQELGKRALPCVEVCHAAPERQLAHERKPGNEEHKGEGKGYELVEAVAQGRPKDIQVAVCEEEGSLCSGRLVHDDDWCTDTSVCLYVVSVRLLPWEVQNAARLPSS